MTYKDALAYYASFDRFGIVPGLDRVRALCAALGDPQNDLSFVHIAGTNGKGSTATMLANVLTASGKKTGLYTSPYVLDFRERMRIDGAMIAPSALAGITEQVKAAVERITAQGVQPTAFEVVTAAALLWYKEALCDVVVLETGLGGRFDATNLVERKLACILTSISLDHTEVLGTTVAQIAAEKCGILRKNCPVVVSADQNEDAMAVIRQQAQTLRAPLLYANMPTVLESGLFGTRAIIDGLGLRIPLIGAHMAINAASVVRCARALGIADACIVKGIAATTMTARMEILSDHPLILRDGGHNAGCAAALAAALRETAAHKRTVAVCGMMRDKDVRGYLSLVAPLCARLIAVTPTNPRALDAATLAETAKPFCGDVTVCPDPAAGYALARSLCQPDDVLLVCGSFYLMSDIFSEEVTP